MLKKIIISCLLFLSGMFFLPALSHAAPVNKFLCPQGMSLAACQKLKLKEIAKQGYGGNVGLVQSSTISEKVGKIISYVLGFLGVIFLVLTIYSGFQWMNAGGNEETIKKARDRLVNAVIGLIIVLAAYAITYYVTTKLKGALKPADVDIACVELGGACQENATAGDPCTITNINDGTYQSGLCPSDPSPTFLCCVPNASP